MILITGDSWACGEWSGQGCDHRYDISHPGVSQYLREHGHQVINLGKGGGSNLESASRVTDFLAPENGLANQVNCVLVFQTDWLRDAVYYWYLDEFMEVNYNYEQLKARIISRFYDMLSTTSVRTQVPIYVIGGCSDTIWLERFEQEYPGVSIGCQSWVNLMISNNHRIDVPVMINFERHAKKLVEYAKSKMDHSSLECMLRDMDLSQQRSKQLSALNSQGLMCADRTHPNRIAHKILFDYLSNVLPQL